MDQMSHPGMEEKDLKDLVIKKRIKLTKKKKR